MSERKKRDDLPGNQYAARSQEKSTVRMPAIRLQPTELQRYRDAAQKQKMKFSAWVRHHLDRASKTD